MTTFPSIAEIETGALVSWPALEEERDGAWLSRFSRGYSRRSNSVQSMDPADDSNAEARLDAARARYAAHGLPACFRITPLAGPNTLAALDKQGWSVDDRNLVMAMPLRKSMRPVAALTQGFAHTDLDWAVLQTTMAGKREGLEALQATLALIKVPARAFIAYNQDIKPVAANLVVNADGIAFLLNVVVDEDMRGLGYGRAIMHAGLNWAGQQGATTAALQVQADNARAVGLYSSLGFTEQYQYQYRQAPK
ncbi:GNAT family N-acetyltransferase [Devosia sp.]|uniref:GNAT family N-acetyltransferase n=1 Tax=Devosia sp. TaxID=1871048 RepID=UPI0032657932